MRPPEGNRSGRITNADKLRALQYLPMVIEQGLSEEEYAKLAGIGVTHARTRIREATADLRSRLGERQATSLQAMQQAAQSARGAALANFSRINGIIARRLDVLERLTVVDAQELGTLARAIATAWDGMKDATGLGFAEARARAKLTKDDNAAAALVPDVHVEFLDEAE